MEVGGLWVKEESGEGPVQVHDKMVVFVNTATAYEEGLPLLRPTLSFT